ncbi:MAG: polysaccharide biosynthesis protein, partial [Selenomonas sp.]|nr:polysaccharide biosynthesis protein [Selenomonas sp.]
MIYLQQIRDKMKLILIDAVILAVVPIIALLLRYDGVIPNAEYATFRACLPWRVLINLGIFYFYGLYHRIWHYARIRDLIAIIGAVSISQAVIFIVTMLAEIPVPRSVLILSWLLGIGAIGVSRLMFKINFDMVTESKGDKDNLLIVGAGDAGAMLVRELEQNAAATTNIIGFVDDDEKKRNGRLAGFPILGTVNELPQVVKANKVDEIVIAIPSADGDTIRHIDGKCRQTGAKVRIMPGIYEMVSNEVGMGEMREIRLEDLLRRKPIHLDFAKITNYISGKNVLITGAGGSIGSELARQISRVGAKEIILLGRGENSIYEIHQELKRKFPEQAYHTVIANITDKERMAKVFKLFHPQVVFHAAAHKHVPLMEIQPDEAVKNNVFGTQNVAELADANHAEIFVLISTDKAVNPTSV